MVKDAFRRTDKYQKKNDPEITEKRLVGAKPMMDVQAQGAYAEQVAIEEATKAILNGTSIPTIYHIFYLDFARQVAKKQRRFSGQSLIEAVERIRQYWISQLLDGEILARIREEVFGIPAP